MVIVYPEPDQIIEYNLLILHIINVKKADKAKVMSHQKIVDIIDECQNFNGDLYDKAAVLMMEIIQKHAFESGNRRTAFIVTKDFVIKNGGKFNIKNDPIQARNMQGIRERYFTHNEIKEWIKNGKIREFQR